MPNNIHLHRPVCAGLLWNGAPLSPAHGNEVAVDLLSFFNLLLALALAPLLPGIINRTKATFAGRAGQPLLLPYFDLARLLRKGAVYSTTTTWLFRAGPVAGLATTAAALTVTPALGQPALISFNGDIFLLACLLGMGRFFTILAALDTGSSFEAMGASRESLYAALAEPALLVGLAALVLVTGDLSVSGMFGGIGGEVFARVVPVCALVAIALTLVFLAENSRIPFDDPATHLELTMVHEVMVLDHGGPDLGLIQYGAALKMWLLGSLLVGVIFPMAGGLYATAVYVCAMFALAIGTGVVESIMARFKMPRVPQLLVAASAASFLAVILAAR